MTKRERSNERLGATAGLSSFLGSERARLFDRAGEDRREQPRAAEKQRAVFRAWNEVCANTREGQHVTGLKYLPETNELLVYVEAGSWATEFTMMREIIRARMAVKGVDVAGFVFKTSRSGYASLAQRSGTPATGALSNRVTAKPVNTPPSPIRRLSEEEARGLDAAVAPIEDSKLKEALRNAMGASLSWRGTVQERETTKEP